MLALDRMSPIVISAQTISITPPNTTGTIQAATTPLANPFKVAMLVNEIRFHATGSVGGAVAALFNALRATVRVGRQLLSATLTPVAVMCKGRDSVAENITGLGGSYDFSYVWRFDKPMYLPEDAQVEVDIALVDTDMALLAGTYTVDVAVAGISLPRAYPIPRRITLPYAAKWISPSTTGPSNGAGVAQLLATSAPSDLRNIHQHPMTVTRFTGFIVTSFSASAGIDADGSLRDAQIVFYKHDGELGLRDPSPPFAAFAFPTRSWAVKSALLEPNGYFIADVNYTPSANSDVNVARLLLGMIGYHEIDIEELGVKL